MARCSDLPPELIALIISFHFGAKSHLRQYSLVCRAWLSPSQRRLFHTFRMFNLVKDGVPFRKFLLGAPHSGAYVRDITVVGPFAFSNQLEVAFVANAAVSHCHQHRKRQKPFFYVPKCYQSRRMLPDIIPFI
ncbi:hypothetical protein CPB85DRAFT_1327964 [Mucidula mucida]|nr:hypothetical protein CPB85DRAFT_1327964 [Mucidula mucida]